MALADPYNEGMTQNALRRVQAFGPPPDIDKHAMARTTFELVGLPRWLGWLVLPLGLAASRGISWGCMWRLVTCLRQRLYRMPSPCCWPGPLAPPFCVSSSGVSDSFGWFMSSIRGL
jgi:hypothetical protein